MVILIVLKHLIYKNILEYSKEAVKNCLIAGIKPIMITGDHVVTACSIAKNIGIYHDGIKTQIIAAKFPDNK